MKVEQLYTGCLSQGAYYIESNGEAAVIDPLRETSPYLERAERDGASIKYVFETHFHADFVSGHLTLSNAKAWEERRGKARRFGRSNDRLPPIRFRRRGFRSFVCCEHWPQ